MHRLALLLVLGLIGLSCGTDASRPATPATSPTPATTAATTTSSTVAPSTTTSSTMALSEHGYPVDSTGRRLVGATQGTLSATCGLLVFPAGRPPAAVDGPAVEAATVLAGPGNPGVDQEQFFEIYDWSVVAEAPGWVSLLGVPNLPDQPNLYPGTHAVAEFASLAGEWVQMWSDWCTPAPTDLPFPDGTVSSALLWPEEYRDATVRRQAGVATEEDHELLSSYLFREDALDTLWFPTPAATWTLDPSLPADPSSSRLAIQIRERGCNGGRVPEDREITSVYDVADGTLVMTVFVDPLPGGRLCIGGDAYPITVDLGRPVVDLVLVDGTDPSEPRTWPGPPTG